MERMELKTRIDEYLPSDVTIIETNDDVKLIIKEVMTDEARNDCYLML